MWYQTGDKVRVTKGSAAGVEGFIRRFIRLEGNPRVKGPWQPAEPCWMSILASDGGMAWASPDEVVFVDGCGQRVQNLWSAMHGQMDEYRRANQPCPYSLRAEASYYPDRVVAHDGMRWTTAEPSSGIQTHDLVVVMDAQWDDGMDPVTRLRIDFERTGQAVDADGDYHGIRSAKHSCTFFVRRAAGPAFETLALRQMVRDHFNGGWPFDFEHVQDDPERQPSWEARNLPTGLVSLRTHAEQMKPGLSLPWPSGRIGDDSPSTTCYEKIELGDNPHRALHSSGLALQPPKE